MTLTAIESESQRDERPEKIKMRMSSPPTAAAKGPTPREISFSQDAAAVNHGDPIMVLFREGYIRSDNKIKGDPNIDIVFSIKTGTSSFSIPLGSFTVQLNDYLPFQNVVLLPPTPVSDYFSIIVNVIQESQLAKAQDSIKKALTLASDVSGFIPGLEKIGPASAGVVGDIINLIVALRPDYAIIGEGNTYIVDETRYPGIIDKQLYPNSGLEYLRLGRYIICEDGYYHKDGKFYSEDNDQPAEPTRLIIELLRPSIKSA